MVEFGFIMYGVKSTLKFVIPCFSQMSYALNDKILNLNDDIILSG